MVNDFDLSTTLRQVRRASQQLTRLSGETRNRAIAVVSQALRDSRDDILEANTLDLEASRGQQGWVLEGMKLTPERLEEAACQLDQLTLTPDPIGVMDQSWRTGEGDTFSRYRVPLGVIALVYEIYPEFALQGLGMGLKTANGLVLCSSDTLTHTHQVMIERLSEAAYTAGIPEGAIQLAPPDQVHLPDSEDTRLPPLLQQSRFVDLIIPCGRSSWVEALQQGSSTPVLATALGYGYLYIDDSASWPLVESLLTRGLSGEAISSRLVLQPVLLGLLMHRQWVDRHLPNLIDLLSTQEIALQADAAIAHWVSSEDQSGRLDPIMDSIDSASLPSVRLQQVNDTNEAIQWLNKNGSLLSAGILSDSHQAISRFVQEIDTATILINQLPLQVDYPMDVLMPCSVQKLHTRGPITLESLTTLKYVVMGQAGSRSGRI